MNIGTVKFIRQEFLKQFNSRKGVEEEFAIRCPGCKKSISTQMPWRCHPCNFDNRRSNLYPFFYKCQKCGKVPTALICPDCAIQIFLTDAESTDAMASSIPPAEKHQPSNEVTKPTEHEVHRAEVQRLQREIEKAKLKSELDKIQYPVPQPKTLEEALIDELEKALRQGMALENAVSRVKQRVAEEYKDDSDNLERNNLWIERWRERKIQNATE